MELHDPSNPPGKRERGGANMVSEYDSFGRVTSVLGAKVKSTVIGDYPTVIHRV